MANFDDFGDANFIEPGSRDADAHDHGDRRPNGSDATRVHTPIASLTASRFRTRWVVLRGI